MSLKLDPKTTALVLIDLQKGIVGRQLDPHSGADIVTKSVALAKKFSEVGATVVLVHVGFSKGAPDRLVQLVDQPTPMPPGGMPPEFMEFVPEVASLSADVVILKRQWGAFYGTELDLQLRRRGVTCIVLGGVATNIGVESTAREAWQDNYSVVIAEDACSSMGADMHKFSIEKIMPRIARVRSTDEVLAAMG